MTIYNYCLNDIPGVVAANTFVSFFNPASSTVTMSAILAIVTNYDTGSSQAANSMTNQRITAASGGTLVAASTIPRYAIPLPDPQVQVRIGNPTVTTSGLVTIAYPPPFASIPSIGSSTSVAAPPGTAFLCPPGNGLIFSTAAGATTQMWNITFVWSENP